ncbi:MAG: tetratricopeptide repeat protein [Bacteroidales bacterium]|jgi:TolB-like protein/cytochrome c-type biogenesis protein CcmH/NrfG|nr:tetratricopeptide repeat protein [Bacteroidales bacterium]
MPSILPGYEYDIFISYRQKDNKFDGWVTRFVADLQNELDATFKEDISIYFDENPHDGLLEMHDVDKSLQIKLKCLIFMPILSQTYCDPGSFAWQHEFVAFNKMASEDEFGRDIKLYSGNVSSRIIPIVIRELDSSDIKLVEDELGTRLRAIEFIFSAAGVNRPLTPSDSPEKNRNNTFYRDQINKVAYAVKEVIYGMHPNKEKRMSRTYKTYDKQEGGRLAAEERKPEKRSTPKRARAVASIASAALLVVMLLLLVYPGWIRNIRTMSLGPGKANIATIAVLPVSNLTGNTDLDWIPMSIHDDIITPLSCTRELVVRPKQSTVQFRESKAPMSTIAKTLQVKYLLETAVKGSEEKLRLEVRLVEAVPQERYVWTKSYETSWNELTALYPEIVNNVFREMKIGLSREQHKLVQSNRHDNPEVRKLCRRGEYYMNKLTKEDFQTGLAYLQQAIDLDPADPLPYLTLARAYTTGSHIADVGPDAGKLSQAYAKKALELDSMNIEAADAFVALGANALYSDWDFKTARDHLTRALELNPNNAFAHYHYGWYITLEGDLETAINEFKRCIEIDPLELYFIHNLAWYYLWIGEFEKAVDPARQTIEINPEYAMGKAALGLAYAETGRYDEAIELQRQALKETRLFEHYLGISYVRAGYRDSALIIVDRLKGYKSPWFNWGLSELLTVLGDKEQAMVYVERAFDKRQDFIPWFNRDYYLKPLMENKRFLEIVNSLDYPKKAGT